MSQPRAQLRLLGTVTLGGREGGPTAISGTSPAALLALLGIDPGRQRTREELMALLWPDDDRETGRQRLRQAIYSLRQQFGAAFEDGANVLEADRINVGLSRGRIATDVDAFEAAILAARDASTSLESALFLEKAVGLYAGDLAPGIYLEPIIAERNRLSESHLRALQSLTHAYEQSGRTDEAIQCAHRTIAINPLLEEAYCDLMRLYAAAGKPSAVLRQYQDLERILRAELGEEPSDTTRSLMLSLRDSGMVQVARRPQHPSTLDPLHSLPDRPSRSRPLPLRAVLGAVAFLVLVLAVPLYHWMGGPAGGNRSGAAATQGPANLWERRIPALPGDGDSEPTDLVMEQLAEGPIIAGFVRTAKHDVDFVTLQYDSSGRLLWQQRYNGPGNDLDRARSVSYLNGMTFVTGESDNGKGNGRTRLCGLDFATIKYEQDGSPSRSWPDVGFGVGVRRYNGPGDGEDWPTRVAATGDGGCIVAGRSWEGSNEDGSARFASVLLRYDGAGNQAWIHRDLPSDAVICSIYDMIGGSGAVTIAYGTARRAYLGIEVTYSLARFGIDGRLWWRRDIATVPIAVAHEGHLGVAANGDIFLAATSNNGKRSENGAAPDMLIARLDDEGNIKWIRTWDGPAHLDDTASAVGAGSSDVAVVGESRAGPNVPGFAIADYTRSGEVGWTTRDTGSGEPTTVPRAVAFVGDSLYVAGTLSRSRRFADNVLTSYDYVTLKYSSSGSLIWRAVYDGPGKLLDSATVIGVNRQGGVFVTGQSATASGLSILTLKYSPDSVSTPVSPLKK